VPVYVYSSSPPTRIAMPRQQVAPILAPYLGRDEPVGEKLTIAPLKPAQFAALRSKYLDASIAVASASAVNSFAVLCDGKVIGAFALTTHRSMAPSPAEMQLPQPAAYLMSDFPVAPTCEKHLAKLVLYAALSREARILMERGANKRIGALVTTAFARRPTSMKYRGLFTLLSRREDDTQPGKWVLNYGAPIGGWTLAEGLETWRAKHT
jgi:hypothetical protein